MTVYFMDPRRRRGMLRRDDLFWFGPHWRCGCKVAARLTGLRHYRFAEWCANLQDVAPGRRPCEHPLAALLPWEVDE